MTSARQALRPHQRMLRIVAYLRRGAWIEAAALLALVARDTHGTRFGASCEALALEILQ